MTELSLTVYWHNDRWLYELAGPLVASGWLGPRYILAAPDWALAGAARHAAERFALPVTVVRGDLKTVHQPPPDERDPPVHPVPFQGYNSLQGASLLGKRLPDPAGIWKLRDGTFAAMGQAIYRYSTQRNDSMLHGRRNTRIWLSQVSAGPAERPP
jgi:hypothetical protein